MRMRSLLLMSSLLSKMRLARATLAVALTTTAFNLTMAPLVRAQTPASPLDVMVQHDVPMKTRDGVMLYADIYRPNSPERFPVILMRTPYDKSVGWAVSPAAQI